MRRKHWLKDLKTAITVPNCTGSKACFSRLLLPTKRKLRLRSAKPSELQKMRSPFRCRNGQRQPTQNIGGKKRVLQEDVESDYLSANGFQLRIRLTRHG